MFGYYTNGCEIVEYSTLKDANLIKDFSEKDITCNNNEETFVAVKKANNEYLYATNIVCRKKENAEEVYRSGNVNIDTCTNEEDNLSPTIRVSPTSTEWQQTKNTNIKIIVEDEGLGLNKNTTVKYQFVKTGESISSSKWKPMDYQNFQGDPKVSKPIPTKNLPQDTGEYQLYVMPVSVKDIVGNGLTTQVELFGTYKFDNAPPTCTVAKIGTLGDNSWYKSSDVTVSLTTSDVGSGVSQYGLANNSNVSYNSKVSATQGNTTGITWHGKVKDNAGNESTCNSGEFKVDKTGPTVDFSRTNNTITGNASDSFSELDTYYYGTNAESCSGSGSTKPDLPFSDNHYNGKKYYLCAKDKAGNITRNSVVSYSACSSRYNASNDKDSKAEIYKFVYDSKMCTGNSPVRKYKMTRYKCNCNVDSYWKKNNGNPKYLCETTIGDNTSDRNHEDQDKQGYSDGELYYTIGIEYKNSDNGRDACSAGDNKIFTYVKKVCEQDIYTGGTAWHGWMWFPGDGSSNPTYQSKRFNSAGNGTTWYHTGGKYYDVSTTKEDACYKACMYDLGLCQYNSDKSECQTLD